MVYFISKFCLSYYMSNLVFACKIWHDKHSTITASRVHTCSKLNISLKTHLETK